MGEKFPVVSSKELEKFFTSQKFRVKNRSKGHVVMSKASVNRPIVIPASKKELSKTVIKSNLKTADIPIQKLLDYLKK